MRLLNAGTVTECAASEKRRLRRRATAKSEQDILDTLFGIGEK